MLALGHATVIKPERQLAGKQTATFPISLTNVARTVNSQTLQEHNSEMHPVATLLLAVNLTDELIQQFAVCEQPQTSTTCTEASP